jgi:PEP-CTERM motif
MRILLMILAVSAWAACAQAELLHYDAAADFSTTSNPNGAWAYGHCAASVGMPGFTQFLGAVPLGDGIVGWSTNGTSWTDPNINENPTSSTIIDYGINWAPGELALGGTAPDVAQLRWTCQQDGVYDVNATFTGIQNNGAWANWLVSLDSSFNWLAIQGNGQYGQTLTYTGELTLTHGETLDFLSNGNEMTGLSATITQVPEPCTVVLLGLGLVGLSACAWRKRK